MEIFNDIITRMEQNAPLSLCLDFDNTGLSVGDRNCEINKVLVCVDVTMKVLEEAKAKGCELVISHHPVIFHPLKSVTSETYTGKLLLFAIKNNINLYSMHTNLDSCSGGINSRLAVELGLVQRDGKDHCYRTGRLEGHVTFKELILKVKELTNDNDIKVSGNLNDEVEKVAIISGAGGRDEDFVHEILLPQGIQVFITAEVKHNLLVELNDKNVKLIELGHWTSEQIARTIIKDWLDGMNVETLLSESDINPYNNGGKI